MQINTLLFEVCCVFMAADGVLDPAERSHLEGVAEKHKIEEEGLLFVDAIFEGDLREKLTEIAEQLPLDPQVRRVALQEACMAVFADGILAPEEDELLNYFADELGLSDKFLKIAMDWAAAYMELMHAGAQLIKFGEDGFDDEKVAEAAI